MVTEEEHNICRVRLAGGCSCKLRDSIAISKELIVSPAGMYFGRVRRLGRCLRTDGRAVQHVQQYNLVHIAAAAILCDTAARCIPTHNRCTHHAYHWHCIWHVPTTGQSSLTSGLALCACFMNRLRQDSAAGCNETALLWCLLLGLWPMQLSIPTTLPTSGYPRLLNNPTYALNAAKAILALQKAIWHLCRGAVLTCPAL